MKKINKLFLLLVLAITTFSGCRKYLDINADPASPQNPNLASLLPPVTGVMSRAMVLQGVTISQYIQNFNHTTATENYDAHGGNAGGSGGNQLWRDFYTVQGTAINLIIKKGILEEQWDYVGAAIALRAWGLQTTTDVFGEMPYRQAWEPNRVYFEYDNQEYLYNAVDSLCRKALEYLNRTDGNVNQSLMARGDQVYQGDRSKWIKFVYGIMARNWHHLTNKGNYNPDSVIAFVDKSFASNADNFMIVHSATRNDDSNPLGPARDNFAVRRQSKFIVQLLDGTIFYGNSTPPSRDPRLSRMLSASPDTVTTNNNMLEPNGGYRYMLPGAGYTIGSAGTVTFRRAPSTPWGDSAITNPGLNNFTARIGKYLFQNSASFPIMTYFELQFIKAEAAFRKQAGSAVAHAAYLNGIGAHFDFVNTMNTSANGVTQIPAAAKTTYLQSAAVKQTPAELKLTDIMLQKYIGDFGWNFVESWSDLRRYHYYDLDPLTDLPVYKGFTVVTTFSSNNLGPKLANRYRPTNFSEFDWNLNELRKIGATNTDYHTYEMWFSKP
ncbi:SusD/RagB family nutrient-binding outer membrane lipoprotein [Lacibacter sp.]|uniref:SusD/RagB family nutrient-binding outer membrane lipoprotein n=1 Tax=Lacibacter sp. TaxID=1915409 RepID=UPI002B4AF056|nr:SusD/RagB family nutrient-binding outer membrane lipoprotein [Lacibacter sp.]HLP36545.1 SusD/RagB family nutrient-binding outer membrane lipoprotein [Lacibacter sp.]